MMGDFPVLPLGAGALLLIWALFAARRSVLDALLLGVTSLLFLFIGLEPMLRGPFQVSALGSLPLLALAPMALLLMIRAVFSGQSGGQRFGMGAVGCLMILPVLPLLAYLSLWFLGSSVPHAPDSNQQNAAAPAEPTANQADARQ